MSDVHPTVVASDLDGTLLRSDGTLCPRTRRALAQAEAAGAIVVLCTARPARWMRPLAETMGNHTVAICANGAVVWDLHAGCIVESFPLEPEIARDVVALLRAAIPGGAWAVERNGGFAHEPGYTPRWPVPQDTIIDAVESLVTEPAVKLMLRHRHLSADALLERAREVVGHLAELSHSSASDTLLEISAAGVSKASTLARLCEHWGIASAQVMAFGDMPNDLAMLQWAGHAVAVANAHPDVLAAADEVTAANDEAGVALVLERVFSDRPDRQAGADRRPAPEGSQ
jgi:Cof subfamily protein (haloacid dehalogenase superfamily)